MKSAYFRPIAIVMLGIVGAGGFCRPSAAQDQEAVHSELRKLRDEMMAAFKSRDIDSLLKRVHPDVVVTWQNAEVSRGRDSVRKFYQTMM